MTHGVWITFVQLVILVAVILSTMMEPNVDYDDLNDFQKDLVVTSWTRVRVRITFWVALMWMKTKVQFALVILPQ